MNVICLEEPALMELVRRVVAELRDGNVLAAKKWITDVEAMQMLNIKSKTTLQKYRDEGKIRYSQNNKKNILYDQESILNFLEKNAQEPF